jgi:very-short-patch-repair endonuclease
LRLSARLVVEIDGGYHARRVRADARRDEKLRRAGYRVLRIQEQIVTHELPEVLGRIRAVLKE